MSLLYCRERFLINDEPESYELAQGVNFIGMPIFVINRSKHFNSNPYRVEISFRASQIFTLLMQHYIYKKKKLHLFSYDRFSI